jgi:serine phosphatase RsbU (regulator of sigma subunit)
MILSVLIVVKLIFPVSNNYFSFVTEIIVLATLFIGMIVSKHFTGKKKNQPLSLLLNLGIIAAVIFLFNSFSKGFLDNIQNNLKDIELYKSFSSIILIVVNLIIALIYCGFAIYLFAIFHELFALRQKKDLSFYFNSMSIFFGLALLTKIFEVKDSELGFIPLSFYVMSVILMVINSFRVAWIAFLTKKQKLYVLLVSVVLAVLFGINYGMLFDEGFIKHLLMNFSPGLHVFISLVLLYGIIYNSMLFITTLFHLPTAEAIDRKVEEVSSLIDLSKLMTRVLDIKDLANSITNYTIKVSNADAAWFVDLKDENINVKSVTNIGFVEAEKISQAFSKMGFFSHNKIKLFDRFENDENFSKEGFENFSSLVSAPLIHHENNYGFLIAVRIDRIPFEEDEVKAIQAFADYAAIAIENAILIEESIEKERLESELKVAREIQYKILPNHIPQYDSLKISSIFVPAFEVGGDYYDFFPLNDSKLGFVIADVSGKGISAAFIMAEVKGIFESLSKLIETPRQVLIEANKILKNSLGKKNFVTAIYGIFDCANSKLTIARAGHVPMFLCRNNTVTKIIPNGIGLGIEKAEVFDKNIKELEITLENDDIITLFTDGISEAKNKNLEEFGYSRLEKIITENSSPSVDELSGNIMKEVSVFSTDFQQHDDITLVLFKWKNNLTAEVK